MKFKYDLALRLEADSPKAARRRVRRVLQDAMDDLEKGDCGRMWHDARKGSVLGMHLLKWKSKTD
jgi:hypothetical protein